MTTDKCGDCMSYDDEDADGNGWCKLHWMSKRCDTWACVFITKDANAGQEEA